MNVCFRIVDEENQVLDNSWLLFLLGIICGVVIITTVITLFMLFR